jgi:translocation and assembly module TamB
MIDSPKPSNKTVMISPSMAETISAKKLSWLNFLRWFFYLVLLTLGGGLSYSWYFLTEKLSPLVEKELANYLNRPLELGKVEALSLSGVRFGKSAIPPTETDTDRASTEAVDVEVDLLKLLTQKKLELDLNLIRPHAYLEQDTPRTWIKTKLDRGIPEWKGISIKLKSIRLDGTNVTLKAQSKTGNFKPTVKVKVSQSKVFFEPQKIIRFNLQGELMAGGSFDLDGIYQRPQGQLNLSINGQALAATEISNLIPLPLQLASGAIDSNLQVNFNGSQIDKIDGHADLNQVTVNVPNLPQSLSQTEGKLNFTGSQLTLENLQTNLRAIPLQVNGLIDFTGKINLQATTKPTEISKVIASINLPQPSLAMVGEIKADLQINGTLKKPQAAAQITTTKPAQIDKVEFNHAQADLALIDSNLAVKNLTLIPSWGGKITGEGKVSLDDHKPQFLLNLQASQIPGYKLADTYRQKLPLDVGMVSGNYQLSGSWKQLNLAQLTGTTEVEVAGGKVTLANLKYQEQNWQGNLKVSAISLAKLPNISCGARGCDNSLLSGSFAISGSSSAIIPSTINARGNAKFNWAGGVVNLNNLQLNQGKWRTLVQTEGLELAKISPESLPQLTGKINTNLKVAGSLTAQDQITATGEGRVILPQGNIAVRNLQLQGGKFTTEVIPQSIELSSFSPHLRGSTSGKLNVSGSVDNLSPEQLKIAGQLDFTQGLGLIEESLTTAFNWDGEKLFIDRATSKGMNAKGFVDINLTTRKIEEFSLDVSAANLDLKTLPLSLPSQLNLIGYGGKIDFQGKIFGNLERPNLEGDVALNNFAVTDFKFNPLSGKVKATPDEGIKLQLSEVGGEGDFIKISLAPNYQPTAIDLQVDDTTVTGLRNEQTFSLTATNIPLKKLANPLLSTLPLSGDNLGGEMSAKLDINLDNYEFVAEEITLKNPVLGNFKGELVTANLAYTQGKLEVKDGRIIQKNSNYLFNGQLQPNLDNPQFQAKVEVVQGDIQELLESLEIFEWSDVRRGIKSPDYAKAADLYPPNQPNSKPPSPQPLVSVGDSNASILEQLDEFKQISILLKQKKQEKLASSVPELEELKGNFDGSLTVSGSIKEGIEAEFDFEGNNWNWGCYQANLVKAKGSYKDGLLTLLPVKIQQEQTLLSLSGTFTKEQLSGQVRVVNLPVNQIQPVVNLPKNFGLGGMVNGNIAISGSEESPLAKGEISINDATINQIPIQSAQASFSYKNSRVNFFASSILNDKADRILSGEAEPLTIKGSFPYRLFTNSITPNNNQFDISLNLADRGFSLLNILTRNEFQWVGGTGKINVDIFGNYHQQQNKITDLHTEGIANLENAMIAAKIFPDKPLTEVKGKILFNFDQIEVKNLEGNFSGGKLSVTGTLPLIDSISQANPLTVKVDNLALDLPELYEGGVKGELQIAGSAIAPQLGGNLELFEGEISLGPEAIKGTEINDHWPAALARTEFKGLNLKLGSNIQIVKAPILSVIATGNLNLNGSVSRPIPQGTIHLKQGQVNLFTSQLKLAEEHDNVAKFSPQNGLDPYLDIQLRGSVTETGRHQFVSSPVASEIKDLSNSAVTTAQTIQVKANVKGLSSQLANQLELTSSPQRSKPEIIALLGGGFFNNFAQGDSRLGLANLASAAFLGSFQGELGEALGFSEFRFFPTQVINSEERTSTLGLGAEIGVDIGSNFSVSVTKVLTNEQAPQYSIRYRVNGKTVLRGSSDFGNDSRGAIEFEHRF